jgi:hypothetical protein
MPRAFAADRHEDGRLEIRAQPGVWGRRWRRVSTPREEAADYQALFEAEKSLIDHENTCFWDLKGNAVHLGP